MQLEIHEIELQQSVPAQFLFPFYIEIHWYALRDFYRRIQPVNNEYPPRNTLHDWEREGFVRLLDWIPKYRHTMPFGTFSIPYQLLMDTCHHYLQGRTPPPANLYENLTLFDNSPLLTTKSVCVCNESQISPFQTANWINCDYCGEWYHTVCVGLGEDTDYVRIFYCDRCLAARLGEKSKKRKLDEITPSNGHTTPQVDNNGEDHKRIKTE